MKKIMKSQWKKIISVLLIVGVVLILLPLLFPSSFQAMGRDTYTPMVTSVPGIGVSDNNVLINDIGLASIKPADLDPNEVDQYWETYTHAYTVGPMWYLQGFKNTRTPMLGFGVLISRVATPEDDMILGMVDSRLEGDDFYDSGNWICNCSLAPGLLPQEQTWYWVEWEWGTPLNIPAETTYYVVCVSNDRDPEDGHYWRLAVDRNGGYDRGVFYIYNFDTEQWESRSYDGCFVTYTQNGGNGGIPAVNIVFSNWTVISQFGGAMCLIGVALSSVKYFRFV